jgi:isoleucyl-tRNA synthetase
LRDALGVLDAAAAASDLEAGRNVSVHLSNGDFDMSPEDLELRVKAQGGFAVSREGGEVVALDLTLNDDLRRRGLLRDLVRQVQELRKNAGFDVADRITLHVVGAEDLADGFEMLAAEVLATRVMSSPGTGVGTPLEFDDAREATAWVVRN